MGAGKGRTGVAFVNPLSSSLQQSRRRHNHHNFVISSPTCRRHPKRWTPQSRHPVAVAAEPSLFEAPGPLALVAAMITPATKEFEPVTDWTALGTFLSIMTVFLLLVRRTVAVEKAVMEREEALEGVRALKSKALEGNTLRSDEDTISFSESVTESLQEALQRYEAAVQQEEQLRNIIPGVVRIVPPSAGNAAEENAALAAKQFLGKDYDIGVPKRQENPSRKLSGVASVILALSGIVLTGLLFLLTMDSATLESLLKDVA